MNIYECIEKDLYKDIYQPNEDNIRKLNKLLGSSSGAGQRYLAPNICNINYKYYSNFFIFVASKTPKEIAVLLDGRIVHTNSHNIVDDPITHEKGITYSSLEEFVALLLV